MAYAADLNSAAARHRGSNPLPGTNPGMQPADESVRRNAAGSAQPPDLPQQRTNECLYGRNCCARETSRAGCETVR